MAVQPEKSHNIPFSSWRTKKSNDETPSSKPKTLGERKTHLSVKVLFDSDIFCEVAGVEVLCQGSNPGPHAS
jgi:hypothetical protein